MLKIAQKISVLAVALVSVAVNAADTKAVVYNKQQPHDSVRYPYPEGVERGATFLDNNFVVEQDTSHSMVNPADMSQTQNRTFYVNCNGEAQKQNVAIVEKFLNDFTTWKWADVLFALDKEAKVYFGSAEGFNYDDPSCKGIPWGFPCETASGNFYGRRGYLNIIHGFTRLNIDEDYRLWIKSAQCASDEVVNLEIQIGGLLVLRDSELKSNPLGRVLRQVRYDTPISITFHVVNRKILKENIMFKKTFITDAIDKLLNDEKSVVTPYDPYPNVHPSNRKQFEDDIVRQVNRKLRDAGEEEM